MSKKMQKRILCFCVLLIALSPSPILSFPVSTAAIRSATSDVNSVIKEAVEEITNTTGQITQLKNSEEDVGDDIFGDLDEYYYTDGYEDSSNSSTESQRPITVILKTIGGQVDHECDDDHTMGEDGECYKVETYSDVDTALNYLKKQARSCLKCIISYVFYDYTEYEGEEREYTDFEEIFDKRTMKFPK